MPRDDPEIRPAEDDSRLKIYLLPNLMTAGNLFCGFLALTRIVEADVGATGFEGVIREALFYILLACIFDLLDGRVARMGGFESPFGREFDSLADVVSFGVAPAFLVHRIVLADVFVRHPEFGWFVASLYLLCGAFRLARFNVLATYAPTGGSKEFTGFPIPAAAGMVASLTLFILWWDEKDFAKGWWRYLLPVILVFLSIMMVSQVRYPAFKNVNWRTSTPFIKAVIIIALVGVFLILWKKVLPVVLPLTFTAYLVYGFVRPHISRRMRKEIEYEEDDEDDVEDPDGTGGDGDEGPIGTNSIMNGLSEVLLPGVVGFLAGYLACIPVGPVNVTIINEGALRGFRHAFFVGLGAVLMEVIYSTIAFAGFAQLFTSPWIRAVMELVSFVVVMAIGIRYLRVREMPATPHSVEVVEQRLNPHTAFATGFVRVLGNPATLLFWIAFAAACVSHEWVDQTWLAKCSVITGIGLGALSWFSKVGYAVSLGHGRFSPKVLLRTAHISGALLVAAGLFMGGKLVVALAKHRLEHSLRSRAVAMDGDHESGIAPRDR